MGAEFTTKLVEEALQRRERRLVLEVIGENQPAIRIYQKAGFEITRKLIGFEGKELKGETCTKVQECDPRLAAHTLMQFQPNLPWQVSGESLLPSSSRMQAYRLGNSLLFLQPLGETAIQIRGLYFATQAEAEALLLHAFSLYPNQTFRLSPAFPEESVLPFLPQVGFTPLALTQYEMQKELPC